MNSDQSTGPKKDERALYYPSGRKGIAQSGKDRRDAGAAAVNLNEATAILKRGHRGGVRR